MTYPCSDAFLTKLSNAKARIVSSDPASSYPVIARGKEAGAGLSEGPAGGSGE
jgi:hypothetical protein